MWIIVVGDLAKIGAGVEALKCGAVTVKEGEVVVWSSSWRNSRFRWACLAARTGLSAGACPHVPARTG